MLLSQFDFGWAQGPFGNQASGHSHSTKPRALKNLSGTGMKLMDVKNGRNSPRILHKKLYDSKCGFPTFSKEIIELSTVF